MNELEDSASISDPVSILLVCNQQNEMSALRKILPSLEMEIVEAASGTEAVQLASKRAFAVILLDLENSTEDGLSTARQIRKLPAFHRVPIIFLASHNDKSFPVTDAYRLGAIDYLEKPLIPEIVGAKIYGFVQLFKHVVQIRNQSKNLALAERRQRESIETALRDSEERHRIWVHEVKDFAIFHMDQEGRITSWNDGGKRLTGYEMDEVIGKPLAELFVVADQHADKPQRELQTAVAQGSAKDENWIKRKDGSRFWASGYSTALKDEQGKLRGFVKIIRDLTERKLLEDSLRKHTAELAEAARRRDEFLAMLSHELRNPLGPIRNAVHILQHRGSEADVLRWAQGVIERQARHMTRLVDDLLDVTRFARGKVALQRQRLDLGHLVALTADDYRPGFLRDALTLAVSVPEFPVWIVGDATRLSQVIGNLLDNAHKFSDAGGEIDLRLACDREAARAEIIVQDRGIGIAEDLIGRLFDMFEQAQQGLARTRGGLGIGLALAKAIVEMHNGEIQVTSEGLGKGARFSVLLPLVQPATSSTEPLPASRSRPAATLSILIIEDHADARDAQKLVLESLGFQVSVATNGKDGIELAQRLKPDVVLCDLGLPGMNGYEVARAIRNDPRTAQVRLLAISGYGGESDLVNSEQAGFELHLTKPVDPEVLIKAIQRPSTQ